MKYLDWIVCTPVKEREFPTPRVICNDGETLSVQAGQCIYCTPRDDFGPWDKVEVGFPSVTPPDSWEEYYDGEWKTRTRKLFTTHWKYVLSWNRLEYYEGMTKKLGGWWRNLKRELYRVFASKGCDSVYGYIPVELVREYIELHGGEDTDASFAQREKDN